MPRVNPNVNSRLIVVVQSPSRVWLSVTSWTVAHQASQSFIISLSLLKFMSIESMMLTFSSPATPFSFWRPLAFLPVTLSLPSG